MLISDGKTKALHRTAAGVAVVRSKDDLTAGDGARHEVMEGKAHLATRTTCNIFELLRRMDIPVAYIDRYDHESFLTEICNMVPVEVVVRGVATGSYIKRNPSVSDGTVLDPPVLEFYYKTSERQLEDMNLPCDDPLMIHRDGFWELHEPNKPILEPFGALPAHLGEDLDIYLDDAADIARRVFKVLSKAWKNEGGVLYDLKIECGINPKGQLVLADVVDCDSWRVVHNGQQLSKQPFRDGVDVTEMLKPYQSVANITDAWSD